MKDEKKTKKQLIEELSKLHEQWKAELLAANASLAEEILQIGFDVFPAFYFLPPLCCASVRGVEESRSRRTTVSMWLVWGNISRGFTRLMP